MLAGLESGEARVDLHGASGLHDETPHKTCDSTSGGIVLVARLTRLCVASTRGREPSVQVVCHGLGEITIKRRSDGFYNVAWVPRSGLARGAPPQHSVAGAGRLARGRGGNNDTTPHYLSSCHLSPDSGESLVYGVRRSLILRPETIRNAQKSYAYWTCTVRPRYVRVMGTGCSEEANARCSPLRTGPSSPRGDDTHGAVATTSSCGPSRCLWELLRSTMRNDATSMLARLEYAPFPIVDSSHLSTQYRPFFRAFTCGSHGLPGFHDLDMLRSVR